MKVAVEAPGFFGKVPSHGDFVSRRLPRGFLDTWDDWLQRGLAESKASLGDQAWLDAYLTAPIWCFALQPGICGSLGWAGVLMPSVDRVGRYFPLTIAAELPVAVTPLLAAIAAPEWFGQARALALTSLEQEDFSFETFDEAVAALGPVWPGDAVAPAGVTVELGGAAGVRMPLDSAGTGDALRRLVDGWIGGALAPYSLWWTEGSEQVEPAILWRRAMLPPAAFPSLLTGEWEAVRWLVPAPPPVATAAGSAQAIHS